MNKTSSQYYTQILILFVITFLAYFNTLSNGFVYDDHSIIRKNYLIQSNDNLSMLFSPTNYFIYSKESSYRPLVTISYIFDIWIWGLNPFGFHLTDTQGTPSAQLHILLNLCGLSNTHRSPFYEVCLRAQSVQKNRL